MYITALQIDAGQAYVMKADLSGRIGKCVYILVKCDLACEPLKSMKGQIVADFIVEHRIDNEHGKVLEEGDGRYMSIALRIIFDQGVLC